MFQPLCWTTVIHRFNRVVMLKTEGLKWGSDGLKSLFLIIRSSAASACRCECDHGLQAERAAAGTDWLHLDGAGPEATPGVQSHRRMELQGRLWAPRLLSVYSGSRVKFRVHHDEVYGRGERSHCSEKACLLNLYMQVPSWCLKIWNTPLRGSHRSSLNLNLFWSKQDLWGLLWCVLTNRYKVKMAEN